MISTLDLISSFAKYKLNLDSTYSINPIFEDRLILVKSSHPILQLINKNKKTTNKKSIEDGSYLFSVTNNISASEFKPFTLITGDDYFNKSNNEI